MRSPRTLLAIGIPALAVLAAGAFFAGNLTAPHAAPARAAKTATPVPTASVAPRSTPDGALAAAKIPTCSIASAASDSRLANFYGIVERADTGQVLFDRRGEDGERTGSVMKTITSAAAMKVLGGDYRIHTRVVQGSDPSTVVIIGGGDPTLSSLPAGQQSVYPDAPKISDLAAQVKAAHPGQISRVIVDTSLFSGETWDATWPQSERTEGYHAPIEALMMDGGRANPKTVTSPRTATPAMDAGRAFAAYLGGASVAIGTAPQGAKELASVSSQPVSTLIGQMLPNSDNMLAEFLARQVAIKSGAGNTQQSVQKALPDAIAKYGIDTSGMVTIDGSGESPSNRVKPAIVASLMRQVDAKTDGLGAIYDALPVSGKANTTLASPRFTGDAADARGHVHAKTGWIDSAYTLAGVIDAADGTHLTFAFYAVGDNVTAAAKPALDTLTADAYRCGANLSNG